MECPRPGQRVKNSMSDNNKKTILLVEDEVLIAMAEARMLERRGFNVLMAHSGEEAVKTVDDTPGIDLVLMDIDLGPGIDGTEAAERILKGRDIPVVFLSSHTEPEVVEKTEKITSYGYVVKNTGETVLVASIKMAFKLYEAHRHIDAQRQDLQAANEELRSTMEELESANEELQSAMEELEATNEELESMNEELVRSQEEILERNETIDFERRQLISLFDSINESVYVTDMETYEILFVNKTFLDLLGKDPVGGICYREFQGLDRPCEFCTNDIIAKSGGAPYIWEYYNPKVRRHFQIVDRVIRWPDGRDVRFEFASDITERKLAEEETRLAQSRLQRAEIVSKSGNWEFHISTNKVFASAGARAVYGIGRAEWTIPEVQKVPLPEYRPMLDRALSGLVNEGAPYDVEFTIRRPDNGETVDIHSIAEFDREKNIVFGVIRDITERSRAEKALRESEQRFRNLYETNKAVMLVVDPGDGAILNANSSACSFYGWTRKELLKMTIHDINTLSHDELQNEMRLATEEKRNYFNFKHQLADGSIRDVELYSTPMVRDGKTALVSIIQDITSRKRIEEALRESEERWHFALEGAGDGVWDWDIRTNNVYFSPRWKKMIGYAEDEIKNDLSEWESRVHPDDIERVKGELTRYFNGEDPSYISQHRLKCKDGSYKWILDRGRVMSRDQDGKPLRAIGTHSDITALKKMEEELLLSAEEKQALLRELQHRVKNSLATIASLVGLELEKAAAQETREALDLLRSRIESLSALYTMLYERAETREVELGQYLQLVVQSLEKSQLAGDGRVKFRTEMDNVKMDAKRASSLGLVVNELVMNAIKHAFPGNAKGTISVAVAAKEGGAVIEVSDDGRGLPEGFDLPKAKGMGLSLVELLARQVGGTLDLRREKGMSVFRITVPED